MAIPQTQPRTIILETSDEVRFEVDINLLGLSGAFAGMADLPQASNGISQVIHLSFTTSDGFRLLLAVLSSVHSSSPPDLRNLAHARALIDAVRIAAILDIPTFATRALDMLGTSPSCGLRYAIGQAFDIDTTTREYHPFFKANHKQWHTADISFPLDDNTHETALAILSEHAAPHAIERWTTFCQSRIEALEVVTRWWTTGDTGGEVSLDGPREACSTTCTNTGDEDAFYRMLADQAPIALAALAIAKTRTQRTRRVGIVVKNATKDCPNCRSCMMDLYLTGLRAFNARSPEML